MPCWWSEMQPKLTVDQPIGFMETTKELGNSLKESCFVACFMIFDNSCSLYYLTAAT